MEFVMETELLPAPAGRPHNWRKHTATIACAAFVCVLLIIVYVKLESVNIEEKGAGCKTGLRGRDEHKGQGGAPETEGHPGEAGILGPTEPKRKPGSEPAGLLGGLEKSTAGIQNLTSSNGIVEGIIAGTNDGVVIISLDSRQQRKISNSFTLGVAFNWQSRKVYWIDFTVGIMISDLDGSHAELLLSDTSFLCGLAVDQITGNFYYGVVESKAEIRVCDSMGQKCATIASGVNLVGNDLWRDIALFPSEAYIFWSSPVDKKRVTRANMDGTNATVIILDDIWGLHLDDITQKLYWAKHTDRSIGYCDLNGNNRNVLLDTTAYSTDIAVDGDTVYLAGESAYDGDSIGRHSPHVYSVTNNGQVSFIIANTTGPINHVALFGSNKVSPRPNPCSNSPCANLCVLTRTSYTCL